MRYAHIPPIDVHSHGHGAHLESPLRPEFVKQSHLPHAGIETLLAHPAVGMGIDAYFCCGRVVFAQYHMEFPRLGNSAIYDRRRHLEEGLRIEIAVGRLAIGLPGRTAVTVAAHVHDGHELYIYVRAARALYLDAEAVVAHIHLFILTLMQEGIHMDVRTPRRVLMGNLHPYRIGRVLGISMRVVFLFLLTAAH